MKTPEYLRAMNAAYLERLRITRSQRQTDPIGVPAQKPFTPYSMPVPIPWVPAEGEYWVTTSDDVDATARVCDCGAESTYGTAPYAIGHSDWCTVAKDRK